MIPRTLVPKYVCPPAADEPGVAHRLSTTLDERTLVPAGLPVVPLDARTNIPAHLPLEALAARVLIPRDMPTTPLEAVSAIPLHVPLTVLDSRVAVPKDTSQARFEAKGLVSPAELPDVLDPDVITTGEVNLLPQPVEERATGWKDAARVASVIAHFGLIIFVLLLPKLFPYYPPTQAELELARQRMSFVYLRPLVEEMSRAPAPPQPQSPQVRIDPRVLRQVAPPTELQPTPGPPQSERALRNLPDAPTPQLPSAPEPKPRGEASREVARAEALKAPESPTGLLLPRTSPGRALEENLRDALKGRGTGGGLASGGPTGGGGQAFNTLEMLTPDEGVDFTNYLARVLASVKRNWYAVMPESAWMGDKGKVVIQFRIHRDGNVPFPDPRLTDTSGKEPLDRAAMSSIRASNPFEPLPPAFSGPFIELRFTFLYNLPLNYQ